MTVTFYGSVEQRRRFIVERCSHIMWNLTTIADARYKIKIETLKLGKGLLGLSSYAIFQPLPIICKTPSLLWDPFILAKAPAVESIFIAVMSFFSYAIVLNTVMPISLAWELSGLFSSTETSKCASESCRRRPRPIR